MFLKRLTDYPLANLLHSSDGVALCKLEPEPLKDLIIELGNRGHQHLVLDATDGTLWLLVASDSIREGNLVGDARRWGREQGHQFFIKRTREEFETPTEDSIVLPGGEVIQVQAIYVRPGNLTRWG